MHLKYNKNQAGIGQTERFALDALSRLNRAVIRAKDLENALGYKHAIANLVLSRLAKKGWLQRLKSGVYRIIPLGSENVDAIPENAWSIAMELFTPCYLTGWTAAEHWELTEQIFNSIVVFTAQKQRKKNIAVAGLQYQTKLISEKEIFGIKKIWLNNTPILIADIHRTIIDSLDDPNVGGGGRHMIDMVKTYLQNKDASADRLFEYAKKLNHTVVFKRLGLIAEKIMHLPDTFLDKLHAKIKTGIILLDPHGPRTGPIITRWGIRINIPLSDLT